jgi:hypothetical protein
MSQTTLRTEPGMSVLRDHALVYVPGLTVRSTCPECGRVHVGNPGWEPLRVSDEDPDLLVVKFSCACGTPSYDPPRTYQVTEWTVRLRVTVAVALIQD